jgi:hypothetical protein
VAVTAGNPVTVNVWVRDVNGNVMPGGTKVEAAIVSIAPSTYALNGNATFNVPCTDQKANTKNGNTVFSFTVSTTAPGNGQLNLTITTPGGTKTLATVALH